MITAVVAEICVKYTTYIVKLILPDINKYLNNLLLLIQLFISF